MLGCQVTVRKLAGYLPVVWLFALGAGYTHARTSGGGVGEATCPRFSDDANAIANALQPVGGPLAAAPPV